MKQQSKDPFEAAFEEQEDSPPDSPAAPDAARTAPDTQEDDDPLLLPPGSKDPSSSATPLAAPPPPPPTTAVTTARTTPAATTAAPSTSARAVVKHNKDDDDDEDEENMDVELGKFSATGDPDKMAKMQAILSRFSEEQMSRYESFRRAGFQKSNMKRLLGSISGTPKISMPMTIVVSGIAKMFVGELVETARIVMTERKESGPIRPCHIREAYRRLKLEGKVPKRSMSRLFRIDASHESNIIVNPGFLPISVIMIHDEAHDFKTKRSDHDPIAWGPLICKLELGCSTSSTHMLKGHSYFNPRREPYFVKYLRLRSR